MKDRCSCGAFMKWVDNKLNLRCKRCGKWWTNVNEYMRRKIRENE